MTINAWVLLALAVPVLLLGELLVRRIRFLDRYNIPVPVAGGLAVSLAVLLLNLSGVIQIKFDSNVTARWWTWLVTPEVEWVSAPAKSVNLPFLVGFFTCIGLNASWQLLKRGTLQMIILLAIVTMLGVIQNFVGVGLAGVMGAPALLGLICGSTTMTGGHGTALGMTSLFTEAGLGNAAVIGATAATFGLVAGGLIGGPIGGHLIRARKLQPTASAPVHLETGQTQESHFLGDAKALLGYGRKFFVHLLILIVCIKAGAWLSYFLQQAGLKFPVYIGSMVLGVVLRNALDLSGTARLSTEVIDLMASVSLGVFLSISMMSLNLYELASVAVPMIVVLLAQVIVMALFARFVTFYCMGRDYDAAVMAGGHCGFGMGATPNAVANMKSLVEKFGPAPRAFLVLPIVGAFLNDFTNVINITTFVNHLAK